MPPSLPNEPGPDFSTFSGGAAAAGGIVGTNHLQTAVDKFAQAVDKLDKATTRMAQLPLGGTAHGAGAAGPTSPFPRPNNPFINPEMPVGAAAPYPRQQPQQPPWFAGQAPVPILNAPPPGGQPPAGGGAVPAAQPINPGTFTPTRPAAAGGAAGGRGGGGNWAGWAGAAGAGMGAGGGLPQYAAAQGLSYAPPAIAAGITGLAAAGRADQTSQLALNTLQATALLGGQGYGPTRMGAMGTAGGSLIGGQQQLQNQFSLNPVDAAVGYAALQQATASVNPYGTFAGARNVMSMMGAANIANPSFSELENAQAVGQFYNPATSLNMMMHGYPVTPDVIGTGAHRGFATTMAPFLNAIGGGRAIKPQALFTQLQPGQRGYVGLQNLFPNATPDQLAQYSTMLELQNALMTGTNLQTGRPSAPKMNISQVESLFNQAASQVPGQFNAANAVLAKYGISQTQAQMLKSQAGTQAAAIGDTASGFTAGLRDATRALSDFKTGLDKILNVTHTRGIIGWGESFFANIFGGGAAAPASSGKEPSSAKTGTSPTSPRPQPRPQPTTLNPKAAGAVRAAKSQVGVPYAYGREAPGVGFDCSALPQWAYRIQGIPLPRTAQDQLRYLQSNMVSPGTVLEGDLVFKPGVGAQAHEAMLIDNGRNIIEAKSTGTRISLRKYDPKEWPIAARPWSRNKSVSKNSPAKKGTGANIIGGGAGHGSGQQVAAYAQSFATGLNHPYVWGGNTPSGWDCSGFANYVYRHFGYSTGGGRPTTATIWADTTDLQKSPPVPGALVLEAGSGGTVANPGHMGIYIGGGKMAAAADPARGTIDETPQQVSGYMIPKGGFNGQLPGGGTPSGSTPAATPPGGLGTPGAGLGDYETEGSTAELSAYSSAILGGITAGSGAANTGTAKQPSSSGGGGTPIPAGGGTPGDPASYRGIVDNVLRMLGQPISDDNIVISQIATESGGQPKAVNKTDSNWLAGHPSVGLMQVIHGTYKQYGAPKYGYPAPVEYGVSENPTANIYAGMNYAIHTYPDWTQVLGHGHGYALGGKPRAGTRAWVGERGPELVEFNQDATVHSASASAAMVKSPEGPWTAGPGASTVYSPIHPAFSGYGTAHGAQQGGGGVTIGCINVTIAAPARHALGAPGGNSAAGMSVTGNDGAALAQSFAKQLRIELGRMHLASAIGAGVTS